MNDYITREETIVGKCPHCNTDIVEVYEKDDTPGFRSKDTWTVYNCDCRKYMDKSKEELWEEMKEIHQHYKTKEIPNYQNEIQELKEKINIYKSDRAICEDCSKVIDRSEKKHCKQCGEVLCPKCYKKQDNMCYKCWTYDPYDY